MTLPSCLCFNQAYSQKTANRVVDTDTVYNPAFPDFGIDIISPQNAHSELDKMSTMAKKDPQRASLGAHAGSMSRNRPGSASRLGYILTGQDPGTCPQSAGHEINDCDAASPFGSLSRAPAKLKPLSLPNTPNMSRMLDSHTTKSAASAPTTPYVPSTQRRRVSLSGSGSPGGRDGSVSSSQVALVGMLDLSHTIATCYCITAEKGRVARA